MIDTNRKYDIINPPSAKLASVLQSYVTSWPLEELYETDNEEYEVFFIW